MKSEKLCQNTANMSVLPKNTADLKQIVKENIAQIV